MKLSVVIPSYNKGIYIEDCVKSLLNQTIPIDEIIIVDDNSNDGSWERISNIFATDPNVLLIRHQKNKGQSSARNTGIDKMSGDIVAFVDADDVVSSDFSSQIRKAFLLQEVQIFRWQSCYYNDKKLFDPVPIRYMHKPDWAAFYTGLWGGGSVAARVSCLRGLQFDYSLRNFEDFFFWIMVVDRMSCNQISLGTRSIYKVRHLQTTQRASFCFDQQRALNVASKFRRLKLNGDVSKASASRLGLVITRWLLMKGKLGLAVKVFTHSVVKLGLFRLLFVLLAIISRRFYTYSI